MTPEEESYWKRVNDNSYDFAAWQYLVSLVDKSVSSTRKILLHNPALRKT